MLQSSPLGAFTVTMRPLNECKDCKHTWHPRGHNLSRRCPNCGSRAVAISTLPAAGVLGIVVVVLVLAAIGSGNRRESTSAHENRSETPLKKSEPKIEPRPDRTRPVATPKASTGGKTPDSPVSLTPLKPVGPTVPLGPATPPLPPVVVHRPPEPEIAPLPRRVAFNRTPTSEPGAWVRRGDVQTRVLAVRVFKPTLTNDAGDMFPAPDPACVVWVETQNLTAARLSLRRWLNPVNEFATLSVVGGDKVAVAKFGRGARIGDQLEGEHKLIPGGPSVVDLLAFEHPLTDKPLLLQLTGSHVGEGGTFNHPIPLEMWKGR